MSVLAAALSAEALLLACDDLLLEADSGRALPGAADLVTALWGSRWAVVADDAETARERLLAAGLPAPAVLTMRGCSRDRPNPGPYHQAAHGLGCRAADCIVLETSTWGVESAHATGARVIAVAASADAHALADLVVADVSNLLVATRDERVVVRVAARTSPSRFAAAARELASMAQTGLEFATDPYDRDRYQRLRKIAADLLSGGTGVDVDETRGALEADIGYATPKVDARGFVRDAEGRICLVRERSDGRWTLPGGWADTADLPSVAAVREVREEAGLLVRAARLLACWDRTSSEREGARPHPHSIYKLVFDCEVLDQTVGDGRENDAVGWFAPDELPPLSLGRITPGQIATLVRLADDPAAPAAFD